MDGGENDVLVVGRREHWRCEGTEGGGERPTLREYVRGGGGMGCDFSGGIERYFYNETKVDGTRGQDTWTGCREMYEKENVCSSRE